MSMMLRRGMMVPAVVPGGLPAEYLAVQYLESTGTQYIDSGLTGNIYREWIAEISDFDTNGNSYASPFGIAATNAYVGLFKAKASTHVYTSFGNKTDVLYYAGGSGWTQKIKLSISADGVYENDVQKLQAYSGLTYGNSDYTTYIFARNNGNVGQLSNVKMKLYSFVCKENGVVIADYVPCIRIADSKPGMYDLVGRQFYTNAGTGEFIAGWYLLPEADGRIEKAMIPVKQGMHIRMDWVIDHTKDRQNDTVLSILNQQSAFTNSNNTDPNAVGGYPIISYSIHQEIYSGTYFEFDATQDLNLFVGYWQESDSSDRRAYGTYINIKIS